MLRLWFRSASFDVMIGHGYGGVASGCVGFAVRMYVWEGRDGWLVAWAVHECVLISFFHAVAAPFRSFVMTSCGLRCRTQG